MDVLRENIGINEGFLGFGKKKSRWQRFKDAIKNNKGKIAAGAGLLGAGAFLGKSRLNYNKYKKEFVKDLESDKHIRKIKDNVYNDGQGQIKIRSWNPFTGGLYNLSKKTSADKVKANEKMLQYLDKNGREVKASDLMKEREKLWDRYNKVMG